jgi:tRNA modification GTPase
MNALACREVAIVSEIPGTTRDVLEVHLELGGYPVIVADTAGLRESADPIEVEGVCRALARAKAADAVLLLLDASAPDAPLPALPQTPALIVWNKVDLAPARDAISISVRTGENIDGLLEEIRNIVRDRLDRGSGAVLTRQRHRHALRLVAGALQRMLNAFEPEIVAEEMRVAMCELGRITGRVDVEELLDIVFRDFCVGK